MSFPSPFDCTCGSPQSITPLDKDEGGGVLEECVAGCQPMRLVPPLDVEAREDIHDLAVLVKDMHRRGELDGAQA